MKLEDLKVESIKDKEKPEEKEEKKKKRGLWDKIFRKNKLKKPNTVAIIYLRENGTAESLERQSDSMGFFHINGKVYHEDRDCVYRLGKEKYPLALIPEWNVTPIGRKSWEDKGMQEKFAVLQDHVMKGIRHAERVRMGERGDGMQLSVKGMVGIGIIIIVVIAVVMNYI